MMKVVLATLSFALTGFAFADNPKEIATGANSALYDMQYVLSKSSEPFHEEHLIKFSICQDETMAQCQEFATDKYVTFRNLDGYLQNDIKKVAVDASPIKVVSQAFEPNEDMDELVKQSIHDNDRRFSHVG